jgi:hypothetical protein
VPSRGRGRPTIFSQELIEEFCGLLVDGMTIDRACKEAGMPSKRTIQYWLEQYPEFRRRYEIAVTFRNQCWMDDTVDIADDTKSDATITISGNGALIVRMVRENTAQRKLKCGIRWKQLNGMRLKAASSARSGDTAKVVEHDLVHGQLYNWELEYEKRRQAHADGHADNGHGGNGHAR